MKNVILVIEDNSIVRENTMELLEVSGYKVYTAKNGKEGLEAAKKIKPNLVLCDIMMPVMDGYGVLQAFENIPEIAGTPFVFITAKAEKADFRKGMNLGADDYLTKPFKGNELLKIVETRLKKKILLLESFENNLKTLNDFINLAKTSTGLATLSEHRTVRKVEKNNILYIEGSEPNFLYFILSGKIKTYKIHETGKEYIINIYNAGEYLGYIALLEEGDYKESAMAMEDSEVALVPIDDFFKLLYSNNDIALRFIKMMSNNFSEAENKLLKLAYDTARKRVAQAVIDLCNKVTKTGKQKLIFPYSRTTISSLSGITDETVSRSLTEFKNDGLIEITNRQLKVLDLKKLENIRN